MEASEKNAAGFEEMRVGFLINLLSHAIHRNIAVLVENEGLTPPQSRVLTFLSYSENRDVFQNDVENWLRLSASTTSGILVNLEKKGLLKRECVSDRRYKKLVLTESGAALAKKIDGSVDSVEEKLTQNMTAAEARELKRLVIRAMENLRLDSKKRCCAKCCPPISGEIKSGCGAADNPAGKPPKSKRRQNNG